MDDPVGRPGGMSQGSVIIGRMFDNQGMTSGQVAQRAAQSYELNGHTAEVTVLTVETPQGGTGTSLVVIPSLSRLDVAADATTRFDLVLEALQRQRAAGWDVWALVPLDRLPEAHEVCRGVASAVQGWWLAQDGLAFTAPEVP